MENVEPNNMKIRIRITVDTSADDMARVLSILTKTAKEERLGQFYVDEIKYLGPITLPLERD